MKEILVGGRSAPNLKFGIHEPCLFFRIQTILAVGNLGPSFGCRVIGANQDPNAASTRIYYVKNGRGRLTEDATSVTHKVPRRYV